MIRVATSTDSQAILDIYAPYITDTAITFETEVPDISAFTQRVTAICAQYPFLVYLEGNDIVGYAYASQHRERAAYRYGVDVSIYVLPQYHGSGVAHRLYGCLFELLKMLGYYNAYAACTVPNDKSIRFHQKLGFTLIGTHHNTGYKLGKWHDVVWLEKVLSEYKERPDEIKGIDELGEEQLQAVLGGF